MLKVEKYFKRMIKRRVKYSKMLLITFLMTGAIGLRATEWREVEHLMDGNIESENFGIFRYDTYNYAKILNGGKARISLGTHDHFVGLNKPTVIISGKNSEIKIENIDKENRGYIGNKNSNNMILFSVDDFKGNKVNGENQVVELIDVNPNGIYKNGIDSIVLVEAKDGYSIKNAKLNLISTTTTNYKYGTELQNDEGYVVKVLADEQNGVYSELEINAIGEDTGIYGDLYKEGKSVLNLNLDISEWHLNKKSTLNNIVIKKDGVIDAENDSTIKLTSDGKTNDGLLTNNGLIRIYEDTIDRKYIILKIEGNYKGIYDGEDGNILMRSEWNAPGGENGENSASDLLHITGNASGKTRVHSFNFTKGDEALPAEELRKGMIAGTVQRTDKLIKTVPVVIVEGEAKNDTFIGTANTRNAGEEQLAGKKIGNRWEWFWTLNPIGEENKQVTPPVTLVDNTQNDLSKTEDKPIDTKDVPVEETKVTEIPANPVDNKDAQNNNPVVDNGAQNTTFIPVMILAQPVTAYVLTPKVNMEMGYLSVGTLDERKNNKENNSKNIWIRTYGKSLDKESKNRFFYDGNIFGLQSGMSIFQNENSLTDIYLGYNKSNMQFFDKYRSVNGYISKDKFTGKGKSESLSLGLTNTKNSENGNYYDLLGQVSILKNNYNSRDDYNVENKRYGLILSGEIGKTFKINSKNNGQWLVEPQGQLIYQYIGNGSFNDGIRDIKQESLYGIRGRVGLKLSYNDKNKGNYYIISNLWSDLKNKGSITHIGNDKIVEKIEKKWAEIGIGASGKIGENVNIFIDSRYEKLLSGTKNKGYKGTLGVNYSF